MDSQPEPLRSLCSCLKTDYKQEQMEYCLWRWLREKFMSVGRLERELKKVIRENPRE